MARILFIQLLNDEYLGLLSVATVLEQQGHSVAICVLPLETRSSFNSFLKAFQPDYVGASMCSFEAAQICGYLRAVKKEIPRIITIVGGPHPTLVPEIIEEDSIDIVCRGEGEFAFLELLQSDGLDVTIRNLWFKEGQGIIKNELRPYHENLDSLPIPNRDIYYRRYPSMAVNPLKAFFLNRGCPYNCHFCSNHVFRTLTKGQYTKPLSPERAIEHILDTKHRWPLEWIIFRSETMIHTRTWAFEFFSLYAEHVNVPFSGQMTVRKLDDDMIDLLAHAGLKTLYFGLDSGSERLRNDILKKPRFSNQKIIDVAHSFRKRNIFIFLHTMFVLPTETMEEALETVNMVRKLGYSESYIYQPLPGTELSKLYPPKGDVTIREFHYGQSIIENPQRQEITNLQRLLNVLTLLPDWLYQAALPTIRKLLSLPDNPVYRLLYFGGDRLIKLGVFFALSLRTKGLFYRLFVLKLRQIKLRITHR